MQISAYLNEMQFDALKEIGNIGSGHAASALSSMLDRPIDINVPQTDILDYTEVVENLGGPENVLAGILMSLTGDVSGMIMFLIHKPFVKILLSNLLGMDIEDNFDLDEMSQSAIKEVGNIIAASYVNAIAELTGMKIEVEIPMLSVDMLGAIMNVPIVEFSQVGDKVLMSKYSGTDVKVDGVEYNVPAGRSCLIPAGIKSFTVEAVEPSARVLAVHI